MPSHLSSHLDLDHPDAPDNPGRFDAAKRDLLRQWAAKYIWWKTPDEAMRWPMRVIAQVMNLGEYDDVLQLIEEFGPDVLRQVLGDAEAGMFTPRSWHYWHYRLGLVAPGDQVPALPIRRVS